MATQEIDALTLAKQEKAALEAEIEAARKSVEDKFRDKQAQAEEKVRKLQVEQAGQAHAKMVELAQEFKALLTSAQRRQIIRILEPDVPSAPAKKKTGGKVPPKYQVGNTTWAGRGHPPKEFREWDLTDEAKKWREANPGQKWPPYKG